jgi:hypothetical protein
VLVPADQHTPEAMHPTMRALRDPPPRTDVGGEPAFGEPGEDLVIVIACVQTPPLRCLWGWPRPCDGKTRERLPRHLEVMALVPRHRQADGHAATLAEDAACGPDRPAIGRVLADLVPPEGGPWSWRHGS